MNESNLSRVLVGLQEPVSITTVNIYFVVSFSSVKALQMTFSHPKGRGKIRFSHLAIAICSVLLIGCDSKVEPTPKTMMKESQAFLDNVKTNTEVPTDVQSLVFSDTDGNRVALADLQGKKSVVLVFTQGFSGSLCPFCITQVSRLIANVDEFEKRDTQILVVYPGKRDHLDEFVEAAKGKNANVAKVPFPLLLDEDLSAARFFKIESRLAHPSTFILDKSGAIKLAYVGADRSAERPSIKAMLEVIDANS